MKNTILLIIIATVCYSFQTSITASKPKIRVKTSTNLQYNQTSEYFYNADGHIMRIKMSKAKNFVYEYDADNIAYEYLSNKILRRYGLSFVDTMILNQNGLVEKLTSNNPSIMKQEREFNGKKNMIKNTSTSYDKDSAIHYYNIYEYQNGNDVSNISTDEAGSIHSTITSTYYTDKVNTIGNENLGSDFSGADSKNPVKSMNWRPPSDAGVAPMTTNFNYHYDEKGRIVIKASYNAKSGKLLDSIAYTYY